MFILEILVSLFYLFMLGWAAYSLRVLVVGIREVYRRRDSAEGKRRPVSSERFPFFSLVVPMKDEEKVAGRLLGALMRMEYPPDKYEVLVVDDGSVDRTSQICEEFQRRFPEKIRYLRRDGGYGKASALNYSLKFAKGEIVGVFDADNLPQSDALRRAAGYFTDEDLAAVQGLLSSLNADENTLTKFIYYEGLLHFNALFSGRDKLSLFVPLAGTCFFIRRKVLETVGGWRDGALSEDLELSARLTEKGYHVKFAPDVESWQENPSSFRQLVGQRVRWFRGCLEVAFEYGRLLGNFSRRSLDAEVFFSGPFVMVLMALTYILSPIAVFRSFEFGIWASLLTQFMSLLTLFTLLILGIGLAYSTKPRRIGNVKWVPFLYLYWSVQVFVAFYACLQIIFKRPKHWKKTSRTGTVTSEEVKDLNPYEFSMENVR